MEGGDADTGGELGERNGLGQMGVEVFAGLLEAIEEIRPSVPPLGGNPRHRDAEGAGSLAGVFNMVPHRFGKGLWVGLAHGFGIMR